MFVCQYNMYIVTKLLISFALLTLFDLRKAKIVLSPSIWLPDNTKTASLLVWSYSAQFHLFFRVYRYRYR
jgi:hypothetical protein